MHSYSRYNHNIILHNVNMYWEIFSTFFFILKLSDKLDGNGIQTIEMQAAEKAKNIDIKHSIIIIKPRLLIMT